MHLGKLLGGRPPRRSQKVIDGEHNAGGQANGSLKPDLLPERHGNVLVAVSGCDLDREVMTLACKVAEEKKAQIFAVYGIEVPRTKAIDDEMPNETEQAHTALDCAATVAEQLGMDIEPEIVQSRHFGHSLVDEAEAHHSALVIVSLPYRAGTGGVIEGADAVEYVLRNAPCTVWVVRGRPPEKSERPERDRLSHVERGAVAK
jgi:nucleotide-binding universal stress UspA family protein